jgi:Ca2+-binding RTX toxin-like protein
MANFVNNETDEDSFLLTASNRRHLATSNSITLNATTSVTAFTAAQYSGATFYAFNATNAQIFLNGGSATGYVLNPNGQYGLSYVTLPAGTWYIGVDAPGLSGTQTNQTFNEVSNVSLAGATFVGNAPLAASGNPGAWAQRGFTITGNPSEYIETEGSGGKFMIMSDAQFQSFQAAYPNGYTGGSYSYTYALGGQNGGPSTEIEGEAFLPAGHWNLVWLNDTGTWAGGAGNLSGFSSGGGGSLQPGTTNVPGSGGPTPPTSYTGTAAPEKIDIHTTLTIATVYGGDGDDLVWGSQASDTLYGGGGRDVVIGDSGADTIYGDVGNNTGTAPNQLLGGHGNDTIYGGGGNDYINGEWDNDLLFGNDGNDLIYGGLGADHLDGGAGDDLLWGGADITLTGDYFGAPITVTKDLVSGATISESWTIAGDNETSDASNDTLLGGNGNDMLDGGAGADAMEGGSGFDFSAYIDAKAGVFASLANRSANLGDAAGDSYISIEGLIGSIYGDTLIGLSNGSSQIYGGAGDDALYGLGGHNYLNGGDGNDSLFSAGRFNTLDGGPGLDLARYDYATTGLYLNLATPGYNTGDATGDTYTSIEGLVGSGFNDTLVSSNFGYNQLWGGAGNDILLGLSGHNYLNGGAGNDNIFSGGGYNAIDGGSGVDLARYDYATAGIVAALDAAASPYNTGAAAGDSYTGVEGLVGTIFNDVLFGDAQSNQLYGGYGNDFLVGGGGEDVLFGGSGSNELLGGAGNDYFDFYSSELQTGVTNTIDDFSSIAGNTDHIYLFGVNPNAVTFVPTSTGTNLNIPTNTGWATIFAPNATVGHVQSQTSFF